MLKALEKNQFISFSIVVLIALEIFFFSTLQSGTGGPGPSFSLATIYHLTMFFLFTFFLTASIKGTKKLDFKYILIILGISLLYAISDEFHQIFVPGRTAVIKDVVIDFVGSFISVGFYWIVSRKH